MIRSIRSLRFRRHGMKTYFTKVIDVSDCNFLLLLLLQLFFYLSSYLFIHLMYCRFRSRQESSDPL